MKKQKLQSGSMHLILLIITALVIIGYLGYVFYINTNTARPEESITPGGVGDILNPVKKAEINSIDNSDIPKSESVEEPKQEVEIIADQDGNIRKTFSTNYYHPDMTPISFLLPSNWISGGSLPTGFTVNSPDLAYIETSTFKNYISKGSILWVTIEATDLTPTENNLFELADSTSKDLKSSTPITPEKTSLIVDEVNAIKFSFSDTENSSNFIGILFIKDGHIYEIEQSYNLNYNNPYPNLIDTIVSSLVFAD